MLSWKAKITHWLMKCLPYLSWNSGVFCKNSNPEWVAKSSRRIGLKSDWYGQVENDN
jgi:hypothetical protein